MEIKIVEQDKNRLVFELIGENHTFCNAIKQELWNDKDIKIASYKIKHPELEVPQFIIEGKDPKKSLIEAAKRYKKELEKFQKSF